MKCVTLLMISVVVSAPAYASDLRQAVGKTDLSSVQCARKAEAVLSSLGATVTVSEDVRDWSKQKSGSISVSGEGLSSSSQIMCRPFGFDMVISTSFSSYGDALSVRSIWDAFYK